MPTSTIDLKDKTEVSLVTFQAVDGAGMLRSRPLAEGDILVVRGDADAILRPRR
jgi:hypothetical protein